MPPRTDCSAAMSCGGFRLASDPLVDSTWSRCAIDKVAVLHVCRGVPGKFPSCQGFAGKARFRHPSRSTGRVRQCAGKASTGRARGSYPHNPQVFHRDPSLGVPSAVRPWRKADPRPANRPPKQVLRHASRLQPSRKVHPPHTLWITCALHGIACAQSVWKGVDKKKVWHSTPASPAKTSGKACGVNISPVESHPQRRVATGRFRACWQGR